MGHQVYLKNLQDEYLQKDYTFSSSTTNKLLLEVHGYKNNFLTDENCIISLKDSFKLEVLVSLIIDPDIPSIINPNVIIGPTVETYITHNGSNLTTDLTTLSMEQMTNNSDKNFTNPGINPTDFEKAFLSTNINDFITNPTLYNNIYLVDERWLTYQEICQDGSVIFQFTYADNHTNTKKFCNGIHYCSDLNIPDYVFTDSYKLETIEEHSDFMFSKRHLPALKSANQMKNLYNPEQRREDILEELEKAHIYIHQINERLKLLENLN